MTWPPPWTLRRRRPRKRARLEGRIAIEELTRRHPALELAAPPTRRSLLVLRGFESVPVRARQMAPRSAA